MQYILYMSFPLCVSLATKKKCPSGITVDIQYVEQTLLDCQHARWHFSEELLEWLATKWRGRILVAYRDVGDAIWFAIFTVLCADNTFPDRTGTTHGVPEASLGYQFRVLRSACNFPRSYLTSLFPLVLSLLPTLLPICLIFTVSAQPLPPNCFLHVPFIFFWSCQFSHLPHSLERWARVSPGYSASGTFQLACIPASGCVRDKMEQIPPGYCYLCFPAVTHKQAYTFPHMHSHMSLHARKMPGRQLPVLQMHQTDSSPTGEGQAL